MDAEGGWKQDWDGPKNRSGLLFYGPGRKNIRPDRKIETTRKTRAWKKKWVPPVHPKWRERERLLIRFILHTFIQS